MFVFQLLFVPLSGWFRNAALLEGKVEHETLKRTRIGRRKQKRDSVSLCSLSVLLLGNTMLLRLSCCACVCCFLSVKAACVHDNPTFCYTTDLV